MRAWQLTARETGPPLSNPRGVRGFRTLLAGLALIPIVGATAFGFRSSRSFPLSPGHPRAGRDYHWP